MSQPPTGPTAVSPWAAADELVGAAWLWIGVRYRNLPEPRPEVSGPRWQQLEQAIDTAPDMDRLRAVVRQYCKHAVTVFTGDVRVNRGYLGGALDLKDGK